MNNILMNAQMALATQQGIKTQTRREVTEHFDYVGNDGKLYIERADGYGGFAKPWVVGTKYKIGQVLWVREPAKVKSVHGTKMDVMYISDSERVTVDVPSRFYKRQSGNSIINYAKWISLGQGIPNGCIREMARTFIRVTDIRVERLNDISEEDAIAEGVELTGSSNNGRVKWYRDYLSKSCFGNAVSSFQTLWESINGKNSFDNRWVWVLEFELISKEEAA